MPYSDALSELARMIGLIESVAGRAFYIEGAQLEQDMSREGVVMGGKPVSDRQVVEDLARDQYLLDCKGLGEAAPFYVTTEIGRALQIAAESLPGEYTPVLERVPAPSGFVWLEESVILNPYQHIRPEVQTGRFRFCGFSWTPYWGFTMRENTGKMHVARGWNWQELNRKRQFAERLGRPYEFTEGIQLTFFFQLDDYPAVPTLWIQWRMGSSYGHVLEMCASPSYGPGIEVQLAAFVGAFWAFCDSKIFVTDTERANHEARKQATPYTKPEQRDVRIIRLRKRVYAPSEQPAKREVDWQCQWIVSGHWRHYRNGRVVRIDSYAKGPKDKPLKVSVRKIFKVEA